MDPFYDEDLDQALVFIDNSNVFIETQKYSARKKGYLPDVQDSCCRIDYSKIINVACEGKILLSGKLYGSEPPPLKKVWEAIQRKTKIEIHQSKRNVKSKEKAVDTALVADAVELIIRLKNPDVNQHFILFSGDRDMIPVVQKAIKYGWHVHVWAYAINADDFNKEKRKSDDKITIHDMKDDFEKVTFPEHHFKEQTIPKDRSLVLTFSKIPHPPESSSKDAFAQKTVETASSVLRLPTQGRFLKENPNKFLVVVYPEETAFRDYVGRTSLYEFNTHVFNKTSLLRSKLEHCTEVKTYLKHSHTEDYIEFADHVLANGDAGTYGEELGASGSPEDFSVVRGKQKKVRTKYSESCKYGFTCKGCNYTHSEKEEKYFKYSGIRPENRWKYKTSMCNGSCRLKGRSQDVCSFAHDISELRCRNCKQLGHEAANCPEQN